MRQRRGFSERQSRARPAIFGILAAGLLSIAALAGCSQPTHTEIDTVPQESDSPSSPSASQDAPSASASSGPPVSSVSPEPSAQASADEQQPPESLPSVAPELPATEGDLTEPVSLTTGVTVELDSLEPVELEAGTPGEVAGSAVRVNVRVVNGSKSPVGVDSAVVSVEADGGELGIGTTSGGAKPLQGEVAPGAEATASYVFMLERAAERDLTISVNYAAGQPIAVFTGSID